MSITNAISVVYAANTRLGQVFLGFSDGSSCTVGLKEVLDAAVFQADLDAIGFVLPSRIPPDSFSSTVGVNGNVHHPT